MEYEITSDPPRGELLLRGHALCKGYFRNPEETASAIDKDGWYVATKNLVPVALEPIHKSLSITLGYILVILLYCFPMVLLRSSIGRKTFSNWRRVNTSHLKKLRGYINRLV